MDSRAATRACSRNSAPDQINRAESQQCPACSERTETVFHFLLECPRYAGPRRVLHRHLGRAAQSIPTLLTSAKALRPLFEYISATERFRDTWGDITRPDTEK